MRKVFIFGFVVVFAFSFINVFEGFSVPDTPLIYVEPKQNFFSPDTTSVGDTFAVNISTSGWEAPGLYSYELKLQYDQTLLEAADAGIPDDHFMASDNTFKVKSGEIHQDEGYVYFAVTLLGDEPAKTGSGVFGYVTFTITTAPPPPLSCTLELKDIIVIDGDGNTITSEDYDVEHGSYEFTAPKPPVYLKVEPETVSAANTGDEVKVDVTINEMESALQLANVTFQMHYNTTLLSTKEEWVTPGDTYSSFNVTIEADYVKVEIQITTEPPFPEGRATLANIRFNATYVPEALTTSPLRLDEVALTDIDRNTIEYDHLESGQYTVPIAIEKEDLNGDGKVDTGDIYIFAIAFGSYPGHPRWDPRADMNGDDKANVIDVILIAMKFHD